ncbi:MAG: S46 family peptidase [Bacteroidia bacterium]|nr:S46 family peptidase [Bacteroidia bacterium]
MFRKILLISILLVVNHLILFADEGMWIPALLGKYRLADMQAKGLRLSAEDIYCVNQASLKDAVCLFGGGCTAGVISDKGLVITNHHCGYGSIQDHSSPEHDYLTDGYWAMSRDEELINKGLTVSFLVRMEDVTAKVLAGVTPAMTETEREKAISKAIAEITRAATEGTSYSASVKPFYYGNEFYLFITLVYTDVRLVGAPPSGIGKFGGDTDNWMWPRHTGDFSLFRIYADANNNPAPYSVSNVPYRPAKSLMISLKGVKKDDFTFVYGYPAQTQEYITSYAAGMLSGTSDLNKVKLRQKILDIMDDAINQNSDLRIRYSAKAAGIANGWKKWMGEMNGLRRLSTIEKKKSFENEFTKWVNSDQERVRQYGHLLGDLKAAYDELTPYSKARDYINEAAYQVEILRFARNFTSLADLVKKNAQDDVIAAEIKRLKDECHAYFKDYDKETDQKLFTALLGMYYDDVELRFRPALLDKKYRNGFSSYAVELYSKSIFVSEERVIAFLSGFKRSSAKKIIRDPAYLLYQGFAEMYDKNIRSHYEELTRKILALNRIWMKAQMEMQPEKEFYPDANQTLRIAYGKVSNYSPRDAVQYSYLTTLSGIMEKDDPSVYDYHVPEKLKVLYKNNDFGKYGEQGDIPVCFLAADHTSGGNSGSPVMDADGRLIGINFDRNWEGTMSDVEYDASMCRNIVLDIRYALFIIDKFAGADYLVREMNIYNP